MTARIDTPAVDALTAWAYLAPAILAAAVIALAGYLATRSARALHRPLVKLVRRARAARHAAIERDVQRMIADLNTRHVESLLRRPVPTDTQLIPRVRA